MKNNKNTITVILIAVLIAFTSFSVYIMYKPAPLEIQGEIDATQVKVGSKIPGRIDSLLVKKGEHITTNTLLYTINSPEVTAKLQQAQAARDAASAQNQKAAKGARDEDIQAAFNTYQKAKAAADFARKTFQRIENLYNEGVVAAQKKDEVETKMIAAIETEKAAKAIYDKAKTGARVEDKLAASALVKQADGVVSEVTSYLDETHIYSPIDGEIANIIAERGELVASGYPVVTVVDLNDVWASFFLREDLLADIQKGSVLEATVPALKNQTVKFEVTYIHVMGDFATWTATKTSGDFDMKTFEVHARPIEKVKGLRPGMSVLVDWKNISKINS
jgi:HlyD family secretion protein